MLISKKKSQTYSGFLLITNDTPLNGYQNLYDKEKFKLPEAIEKELDKLMIEDFKKKIRIITTGNILIIFPKTFLCLLLI